MRRNTHNPIADGRGERSMCSAVDVKGGKLPVTVQHCIRGIAQERPVVMLRSTFGSA